MAFDTLRELGTDRFQMLADRLIGGASASSVARLIQNEWGCLADIRPDTLGKQLSRLRVALRQADSDPVGVSTRRETATDLDQVERLIILEALNELAVKQRERILDLRHREQQLDRSIPSLNVIARDYSKLLLCIQKLRFDLGLDEYRFGLPPRDPSGPTTFDPIQAQLREQVDAAAIEVDAILRRNGIPGCLPNSE